MKLGRTLLGAVAAISLALPAAAEKIPLSAVSAYLNQLETAQAQFTQVNGDGSVSTGTFFLKRPGRMRFEYNPPEDSMVIAGGGSLAVFDPRSNDGPARYLLSETPLKIILQANVNLSQARMVTQHREDGVKTIVRAQDPDHPEYGHIDMVFTNDPVQLRQWVVTDNTGTQTTMVLGELKQGVRVPNRLFNIIAETEAWQKR